MKKYLLLLTLPFTLSAHAADLSSKTLSEISKLPAAEQEKVVKYVKDKLGNKFKENDVKQFRSAFKICANTPDPEQYMACYVPLDTFVKMMDKSIK